MSQRLFDQQLYEATSWANLSTKVQRSPDPLQIFVGGLNYDIGRWSGIGSMNEVKLKGPPYMENPVFAIFRIIDFTFIVQFILTLFAILFTYDAINGERERGTLQLVLANSIPRVKYIIAKCAGSWLGLVIPLSVPILLSFLLILIFKVPLSSADWARILTILFLSLLLFTFFIVLGVLISSLARRSNVSFLIALVVWVVLALILPRAGVLAAGQIAYVPGTAEIEGQLNAYEKDRRAEFYKTLEKRWLQRQNTNLDKDDPGFDNQLWSWMKEDDASRDSLSEEIGNYYGILRSNLRQRKAAREKLAWTFSRLSPMSAYQLAAMSIAGTDIGLKSRYEDSMIEYRKQFNDHVERKMEETGSQYGMVITISSDDGFNIKSPGQDVELDLSDLPRFSLSSPKYKDSIAPAIIDFGLLSVFIMAAFAGAFVSFLRYDIRWRS